jgi:hypothetical protein
MIRFFRSAPAIYADICAQLDAAYGYPNAATKTERSLPLAADLPTGKAACIWQSRPNTATTTSRASCSRS